MERGVSSDKSYRTRVIDLINNQIVSFDFFSFNFFFISAPSVMARQTPLTCSGHTRPVVDLSFSDNTKDG